MVPRTVELAALAAVPDLVHGFERRAPEAPAESHAESRALATRQLAGFGRLLLLRQVHGASVVEAPWRGTPEGDASVCSEPGFLLGIETADCLPVLLVDPRRRAVAAAHAGWRGAAASIASRVVEALQARGSRAGDLLAALGPAIGPCCYEVGEELREAFGPDAEALFRERPGRKLHLDLRAASTRQLVRAGVPEASIFQVDECTCCRATDYYSYRRDGRGAGRMLAFVGIRA